MMEERFLAHLEHSFPELLQNPVIIACSGGLDSMVLLELCKACRLQIEVAHCHFGLRGEASDGDAEFVRKAAESYEYKYHVKHFKTENYAAQNKLSIQEAARELRYAWFEALLADRPQDFLLTAHHADDQLETFLMHLGRGAGLQGLCGIPARQGRMYRPLLPFSRQDLEAYAADRHIAWREDASNRTDAYLRNRIRHHVIPQIKDTIPDFLDRFLDSLSHLQGSREILRQHMDGLRQQLGTPEKDWIRFELSALQTLKPQNALLFELFRAYGFTDWKALLKLLEAMPGKEVRSKTHRLLKDRQSLLLKPIEREGQTQYPVSLEGVQNRNLPVPLKVSLVTAMGRRAPEILYVDKETLKGGLTLRKWEEGDYFCPLGMTGRKKVSKFFKDLKLNQFEKESQWILLSGDDIVWILGLRADDRFKVTGKTREILRIECIDYC